MRKKWKTHLTSGFHVVGRRASANSRDGGQETKRGWGTASRGQRDPATLTRGRPHTGRPELPQDEALLALSQSQEEFIGFDALLAETEAHGAVSSGGEASPLVQGWAQPPARVGKDTPTVTHGQSGACSALWPAPCPALKKQNETLDYDLEKYKGSNEDERGAPLMIGSKGKVIQRPALWVLLAHLDRHTLCNPLPQGCRVGLCD